ncbi:MAG: hypothetical protein LBG97_06875 [Coriobacteriales bacterium]|jgi:hypothetical protein|nr:hypothetical protein [Coriobacteriales bacterium]
MQKRNDKKLDEKADSMSGDAIVLFNAGLPLSAEDYCKYRFEQYKIYTELTDRISQRRAASNTFFISANAALLTVATWFKDDFGKYIVLVSIVGVLFALIWFFSIRSYGQLNRGKFRVLQDIEKCLPLNLYEYEWMVLGEGKSFKTYWQLSHVERVLPFVFTALYVALSVLAIIG